MSDPISVAGTAVGVISLGITACQGLLKYYGQMKSSLKEIADITNRIEDLQDILNLLNGMLANSCVYETSLKAESAKIAIRTVLQCEGRIQELVEMLDRCNKSSTSHSQPSKLQVSRLIYPFRRDTLMALVETVSFLHANLDTALNLLNIAIGMANEQKMRPLVANSVSTLKHTDKVLGIVQGLEKTQDGLASRLKNIEEHLIQMESQITRHRAQPILEPALLQSLMKNQEKANDSLGALIMGAHCQRGALSYRHSNLRPGLSRNAIGKGIQAFPSNVSDKKVVSLYKRWTFCNQFLRFSVCVSLGISRGAGGLSICPGLTLSPIVPWDSPVFSLLERVGNTLDCDHASVVLQDTLKQLLEYFHNGKASPLDTLPNGDTIFHVVARWHVYASRWDPLLLSEWRGFLNELLNRGISSSAPNHQGETPADAIVRSFNLRERHPMGQVTIMICSDLFARGGYMTKCSFDGTRWNDSSWRLLYYGWRYMYHSMQLICDVAKQKDLSEIDIPEELLPLISKSEHMLNTSLRKGVDMRWTMEYYTQWPKGLDLLLQAGYVPDLSTFQAAIYEETGCSVKLLIGMEGFWLQRYNLLCIRDSPNKNIQKLVVQEIAAARRRLQDLAEFYLSSKELTRLGIRSDSLLGYHAAEVYKSLKSRGVDVGYTENETGWLIYDSIGDDLYLANLLWDAGFRQVDEVDEDGATCLTNVNRSFFAHKDFSRILKKANWLISKGADIYRKKDGISNLQRLADGLGIMISRAAENSEITGEIQSLDQGCKDLMHSIFTDDTRDSCTCPCSLGGCSPLSRFLSGLCYGCETYELHIIVQKTARVLEDMAIGLEIKSPKDFYSKLSPGLLRFLTFSSLDIPHTCVCDDWEDISAVEASDIQELYVERYVELEQLHIEFLSEYKKSPPDLPSFLMGYWYTRINQVLSRSDIPAQEEIDRIRELGVILEL